MNYLLITLPVVIAMELMHAPATWIFVVACIAIIPLAAWMGRATEHLTEKLGAGLGGFLNATFGNAAELILAALALRQGLTEVVKASITGSIIGNILLVLGLSIAGGGLKFPMQRFNRSAASLGGTLLALSTAGLLIPALFHRVGERSVSSGKLTPLQETLKEGSLSLEIAVVLFLVYLGHLIFSLKTHKDLFTGEVPQEQHGIGDVWPIRKAIGILIAAAAGVAVVSECLIGAVAATAEVWGLSQVFIGVIVVAVVGNAAEHSTAILVAMKNKMDLAMQIAVGSSIQIALFVAPLLVFLSYAFGNPMNLVFTDFEVLAVVLSVALANLVCQDGESHWMEGVMLLALYVLIGLAFFALPA